MNAAVIFYFEFILFISVFVTLTSGCDVYQGRMLLTKKDLKKVLYLNVSDTALPGERLVTFEVVPTGKQEVKIIVPDNTDYAIWKVRKNQLDVVLGPDFPDYELNERIATLFLGSVQFRCGPKIKINARLALRVRDSNNHSPEFVDPADLVFMVQFPLTKGDLLSKVAEGPEIKAFDVDLFNRNISFSVFGVQSLEAVYVRRDREKWPMHVVDIRVRSDIIEAPLIFHLIAMDRGKPPLLGTVTIQLIAVTDPTKD